MNTDTGTVRRHWRMIGRQIAFGFLDVLVFLIIVSWIIGYLWPVDSTDRDRFHRSGVKIHTDHATGLQYLSNGHTLTPRLGRDGKQLHEP